MDKVQRFKADLQRLVILGNEMYTNLIARRKAGDGEVPNLEHSMELNYQRWYTESLAVIKQILPDRLQEFEQLYKGDGRRKQIDVATYTIQDWLNGFRSNSDYFGEKGFDDTGSIAMRFRNQLLILKSVEARFDSFLFDIRHMVQADLFDSDLDAARELTKGGFLRAAGSVAGVVLEKHLGQVMDNHNVRTRKKNPTINDFNELLKSNGVLDVPAWRQIQRLGDIRNLCSHNKEREPTEQELDELIDGVDKYTKTLF